MKFALLLILSLLVPTFSQAEVSAPTYFIQAQSHIVRLEAHLANPQVEAILRETFPPKIIALAKVFILLHDLPKVMTMEELKAWGYKIKGFDDFPEETVYASLARYHGRARGDLTGREKKHFKAVKKAMNRLEAKIKQARFYGERKLSAREIQMLEWLDHILDVTDTGVFRKPETDSQNLVYDGADWLEERDGDFVGGRISRKLEDVISGLSGSVEPALQCREVLGVHRSNLIRFEPLEAWQ